MDFKDKKVTVMGLGLYLYGSGISATKFLVERGAKVTVTDLKSNQELDQQIKRLGPSAKKITFILGRHREQDFKNVTLVVKNPGVPSSSKYLKIATKYKIPIETDISIFFQLVDCKRIIGITGTRGKSTTTSLIYEIIKSLEPKSILGGNISRSPLSQLSKIKKHGLAVLELSSWMLESLELHQISPHISVFTNIYPDHLNTYRDMKDYISAKENIFKWQNAQDFVVINRDNKYTRQLGQKVPAQRFWISLKDFKVENGCFVRDNYIYFRRDEKMNKVMATRDIKLLGEHNLYNALSAICVGMIFGVKTSVIKKIVGAFVGIADRLELIREVKGVKYYNDTTSTTPEATMAALRALTPPTFTRRRLGGGRIILIAGGSDKGLDFKQLAKEIKKHCQAVILLKGLGTDRLWKKLSVINYQLPVTEVSSITDAVGLAGSFARKGDIILLSPACASFGLFKNEFDRGDQFKKIVSRIYPIE